MSNFTQTLCIFFAFAAVSLFSNATASRPHLPAQAPAPQKPPPCDHTLMFKMINCLPYLQKGSRMDEPVSSCCSGVKDVCKVDSTCVSEALKRNVELGFDLNMTRVASVTSTCGFMHGSLDKYIPSLLEIVQSAGPSSATPMALSPKSGGANYSLQQSSGFKFRWFWIFLPAMALLGWGVKKWIYHQDV
ncbi:non-specific lipid-transfer protein-like protein [Artemisia annua]|uniref:Non-specific lipid-transfer protein-like protein n=1 Tax=Artemisia annua TaxID=35608 RepID=A0A2U1QD37_ARTAN|nr:non-specific lipid-transfer protein-like protein [Artemisia annua]